MFKNWSEKIRDKSWDKYGKIGGRHGIRFAVQPPLTRKILKKLSQASREAAEIFFLRASRNIFLEKKRAPKKWVAQNSLGPSTGGL